MRIAIVTGITLTTLVITLLTHNEFKSSQSVHDRLKYARVPVTEEEIPADKSASANANAANFPNSGLVLCMPD